tara:strand:+ start:171 stop:389 length:219 start_codon:yes stop_codon:yes gene_type:complete
MSETKIVADLDFEISEFQRNLYAVGQEGRASIDEIIDALHLLTRDELEKFYEKRVLPWDKRSIREILGGSKI